MPLTHHLAFRVTEAGIINKKKANATKAAKIIDGSIAKPKHDILYPVGVTYEQAAFGIDIDSRKERHQDDFAGKMI